MWPDLTIITDCSTAGKSSVSRKLKWRNGIPTVVSTRGVRHVYWLSDVRAVCDLCPGPLCDDAGQKAELRRISRTMQS